MRTVTVREGTRMPQSFRNAWRWLLGASAAAMLIAGMTPAANAQTPDTGPITMCIARNGHIIGINVACKTANFKLTWNIPGPAGAPGVQGPTGPTGPMGDVGPTGAQGGVGPIGPTGPMGQLGMTGPEGSQGLTGPTGPTGNMGFMGPSGPAGATGTPGTSELAGDFVATLTGGSLGTTIGTAAQIQLVPSSGNNFELPSSPLFLGPGNGASGEGVSPVPPAQAQVSVETPTPGGTAFHLQVMIAPGPSTGAGGAYTFVVCDAADCVIATLSCRILQEPSSPPPAIQVCSDDADSLPFLPGDPLSIEAYNSGYLDTDNDVDVSWSLDYAIDPADVTSM